MILKNSPPSQKIFPFNFHLHTTYSSDSTHTVFEIAEQAKKLGFKKIAITDHKAHFLGPEPVFKKYLNDIKKAAKKFKIKIIPGLEICILAHGLDWEDYFNQYQFLVIASFHRLQSKKEFLEKTLRTIHDPRVNILGHPIRVLKESGIEKLTPKETKKIIQALVLEKKKGHEVAVEINATDLWLRKLGKWPFYFQFYRKCRKTKIPFSLGSDAHTLEEVENIPYLVIKKLKLTPSDFYQPKI